MSRPTLLISGSRDASLALLDYARRAVLRALENGWWLIAGDAAGVDQAVAETVRDHFQHEDELMLGMRVYGLGDAPRHGIGGNTGRVHYQKLTHYSETAMSSGRRDVHVYNRQIPITTYTDRDRYMVREADKVLCIWNGVSRGTLAVYEYAEACGKEAWLRGQHE